eukprot:SAG11_NODE_1359_length_5116_cov_11.562687_2_plen_345_part_00
MTFAPHTNQDCIPSCPHLKLPLPSQSFGDRVRLIGDLEKNKQLAKDHGGWASRMGRLCVAGEVGAVWNVDGDGDVHVRFEEPIADNKVGTSRKRNRDLCFNPDALVMVKKAERKTTPVNVISNLMDAGSNWQGSEEKAITFLESEAEELLQKAMPVLFADAGDSERSGEGAMHCCKLLISLYTKQNRKKDLKAMLKRKDEIKSWCDDSSDDESSGDESSDICGSDSDDSDQSNTSGTTSVDEGDVQDELMAMFPRLTRALQDDNDEQQSVEDIQEVLAELEKINRERPPKNATAAKDRADTREALQDRLKVAVRRDRVAQLLGIERATSDHQRPRREPTHRQKA